MYVRHRAHPKMRNPSEIMKNDLRTTHCYLVFILLICACVSPLVCPHVMHPYVEKIINQIVQVT